MPASLNSSSVGRLARMSMGTKPSSVLSTLFGSASATSKLSDARYQASPNRLLQKAKRLFRMNWPISSRLAAEPGITGCCVTILRCLPAPWKPSTIHSSENTVLKIAMRSRYSDSEANWRGPKIRPHSPACVALTTFCPLKSNHTSCSEPRTLPKPGGSETSTNAGSAIASRTVRRNEYRVLLGRVASLEPPTPLQ